MKYPSSINKKLQEVKEIISEWPVEILFDDVLKWILQFDTSDFEIPIRVIKNLNVIGFDDLNSALSVAFSKLERMAIDKNTKITSRNTLFAGIGDGGKSGAMISYNFRLTNELSEENFLDDESIVHIEQGRIENIVLVDDIVSTGSQASKEINKLAERVIPLGVKNIFLLTAVGMKDGIAKVEKETSAFVFSAFEYGKIDTASSLDSKFYDGIPYEHRSLLKERLEYYGKITSKSPLGYGGLGALIVFYYNTPNSTLPIIWSTLNSWLPLFKRVRKINGIASYYKQFDKADPKKKTKTETNDLILFVEGKTDEMFFDLLLERIKLKLGIKKIDVISLGGGFMSEKLVQNLQRFSITAYIFVVENDIYAPKSYKAKTLKYLEGKPFVQVEMLPKYFDLKSIIKDEEYHKLFRKDYSSKNVEITEENLPELERFFMRRMPLTVRQRYLEKLLAKYPNEKEISKLIDKIELKFKEMKTPPNKV